MEKRRTSAIVSIGDQSSDITTSSCTAVHVSSFCVSGQHHGRTGTRVVTCVHRSQCIGRGDSDRQFDFSHTVVGAGMTLLRWGREPDQEHFSADDRVWVGGWVWMRMTIFSRCRQTNLKLKRNAKGLGITKCKRARHSRNGVAAAS